MKLSTNIVLCICMATIKSGQSKYEPNWASLDSRPLPTWYDQAKFGIFIHWGVFSVPSYGSAMFWLNWERDKNPDYVDFMKQNYPPDFTYADFAAQFKAEFYDPDQWADILEASGAKYVVLVSKHDEGFTNWPSSVSWNWNAVDVGPHRDLVGDLATAIRSRTKDIRFGVYNCLAESFNRQFIKDNENKYQTQDFIRAKAIPSLMELVNTYKPDLIWSDGDGNAPGSYWNSTQFLAWLYNESPVKDTVVTNDRWGSEATCHHGGYFTCTDRYNPGTLQPHKFENAQTMDRGKHSWGFIRKSQLKDYLSIEEVITQLVQTVSCGGNLLLNIGPTHDGRIMPIFEERLRQIGQWLNVNGEAIYSTIPWTHQNDTLTKHVWYTSKKLLGGTTYVYAITLEWPENNILNLGAPKVSTYSQINLMGYKGAALTFKSRPGGGADITIPPISINDMPCRWAWVFKIDLDTRHVG